MAFIEAHKKSRSYHVCVIELNRLRLYKYGAQNFLIFRVLGTKKLNEIAQATTSDLGQQFLMSDSETKLKMAVISGEGVNAPCGNEGRKSATNPMPN